VVSFLLSIGLIFLLVLVAAALSYDFPIVKLRVQQVDFTGLGTPVWSMNTKLEVFQSDAGVSVEYIEATVLNQDSDVLSTRIDGYFLRSGWHVDDVLFVFEIKNEDKLVELVDLMTNQPCPNYDDWSVSVTVKGTVHLVSTPVTMPISRNLDFCDFLQCSCAKGGKPSKPTGDRYSGSTLEVLVNPDTFSFSKRRMALLQDFVFSATSLNHTGFTTSHGTYSMPSIESDYWKAHLELGATFNIAQNVSMVLHKLNLDASIAQVNTSLQVQISQLMTLPCPNPQWGCGAHYQLSVPIQGLQVLLADESLPFWKPLLNISCVHTFSSGSLCNSSSSLERKEFRIQANRWPSSPLFKYAVDATNKWLSGPEHVSAEEGSASTPKFSFSIRLYPGLGVRTATYSSPPADLPQYHSWAAPDSLWLETDLTNLWRLDVSDDVIAHLGLEVSVSDSQGCSNRLTGSPTVQLLMSGKRFRGDMRVRWGAHIAQPNIFKDLLTDALFNGNRVNTTCISLGFVAPEGSILQEVLTNIKLSGRVDPNLQWWKTVANSKLFDLTKYDVMDQTSTGVTFSTVLEVPSFIIQIPKIDFPVNLDWVYNDPSLPQSQHVFAKASVGINGGALTDRATFRVQLSDIPLQPNSTLNLPKHGYFNYRSLISYLVSSYVANKKVGDEFQVFLIVGSFKLDLFHYVFLPNFASIFLAPTLQMADPSNILWSLSPVGKPCLCASPVLAVRTKIVNPIGYRIYAQQASLYLNASFSAAGRKSDPLGAVCSLTLDDRIMKLYTLVDILLPCSKILNTLQCVDCANPNLGGLEASLGTSIEKFVAFAIGDETGPGPFKLYLVL